MTLILASASPRRRQLLAALGLPFIAETAHIDEEPCENEPPRQLVARLSREKAMVLRGSHPHSVIVGADTIVVLDDRLLGKPANAADAWRMLLDLRGRQHEVLSAVTALDAATGRSASKLNESIVWMRDYSEAEIDRYVASGDPLDKAGAYAIQHEGFAPVAQLEGCYSAIMGLPLGDLAEVLSALGVPVETDVARACAAATGSRCCLASP